MRLPYNDQPFHTIPAQDNDVSGWQRSDFFLLIFTGSTRRIRCNLKERTSMILAILMVLGAGLFRLAAHEFQWWNVAPIGAMALLGGMYLGRRHALWVPLAVLASTDLVLNAAMGYPILYWPRLVDYGAFAVIGLLGLWARERKPAMKIGAALATPFAFFLISNFAVWLFGLNLANEQYPKTLAGLLACYAAGLPFLRGTMIGDWAFMTLFALAVLLVRRAAGERMHWLVAEARA
jgi:membrane-associated HD superfamily phosphohydrolase